MPYRIALHAKNNRTGQTAAHVHQHKIEVPHAREAEDIAQRILGKTWYEKKHKRDIEGLVRGHESVEPVKVFFLYDPADQSRPEVTGDPEGDERTGGQADG